MHWKDFQREPLSILIYFQGHSARWYIQGRHHNVKWKAVNLSINTYLSSGESSLGYIWHLAVILVIEVTEVLVCQFSELLMIHTTGSSQHHAVPLVVGVDVLAKIIARDWPKTKAIVIRNVHQSGLMAWYWRHISFRIMWISTTSMVLKRSNATLVQRLHFKLLFLGLFVSA